jgi:hypothetical protein
MSEKIYLGKGKSVGNYDMVNFSICLSSIPKEKIIEYEGKKYLKCTIAKMKQVDKYGKDYTIYVDEFVPEKKEEENPDDLPF